MIVHNKRKTQFPTTKKKKKKKNQNQIIKKNLNTKLLTKSFGSCIHTKTIKQNWREGEGGGCSKD